MSESASSKMYSPVPPSNVILKTNDGEEQRVAVKDLKPATVANLFTLVPDSVYLSDAQVPPFHCPQTADHQRFENLDPLNHPFTVHGDKKIAGAQAAGHQIIKNNPNNLGFMTNSISGGSVSNQVQTWDIQASYNMYVCGAPMPKNSKQQDCASIRISLKYRYLKIFKTVSPFSLPFTFDIEKTWVSLALSESTSNSEAPKDHAILLKNAFKEVNMLIIEGTPASGKTSLMRRLAFEWAKEKEEMTHYDLVVYVEFRAIRDQRFNSIVELVSGYLAAYLDKEDSESFARLMKDKSYYQCNRVLVLLDGYDESSLDEQCKELRSYLSSNIIDKPLLFHIVITTRPGYLSKYRGKKDRFAFADVLGFITKEQKETFVQHFFSRQEIDATNANIVLQLLESNDNLNKLSEIPLYLLFICLVHEKMVGGTLLELFCNIIWWLLDRYQNDFPDSDVPKLFGFEQKTEHDNSFIIQENYLKFSQIQLLGQMALRNMERNVFKESDLSEFKLKPIIEQVGLLRKEDKTDLSHRRIIEFSFAHKTVQEFLAALSFFFSNDIQADETFIKQFYDGMNRKFSDRKKKTNTIVMNEFEKFLWRIVSSSEMKINPESRRSDFFIQITSLTLDLTVFDSAAGISIANLNFSMAKCLNVTHLEFYLYLDGSFRTLTLSEPIDLSTMTKLEEFEFCASSFSSYKINEDDQIHSEQLVPRSTFRVTNERFFLMPKTKVKVKLEQIEFQSPIKFMNTINYLTGTLKSESTIELIYVLVRSSVEENSYFMVDTNVQALSNFTPSTSILDIFSDGDMNEALKYVLYAKKLRVVESKETHYCVSSFEIFTNLDELGVEKCEFPIHVLFAWKRSEPLALVLTDCKYYISLDFTSEYLLAGKSVQRCLWLSFDCFAEKNIATIHDYLQKFQGIDNLVVDFHDKTVTEWTTIEEEFAQTFSNLALKMKGLNFVEFVGENIRNFNENKIVEAGQGKKISFSPFRQKGYFDSIIFSVLRD